jgi:subfamily B ATP-binding cassette protein MsbA
MCAVAAFNGGAILLLKPIVDRIFIARDLRMLWLTVAAVPLLMAGKTAVCYIQNYLMSWIGQSVTQRIREDLFQHLLEVPPDFPKADRAAEILSRVTNDLAIVQTELVSVPLYLIRDSMTLVVLTGSLFYLDWRFALIALAGAPATAVAFVVLSRKMRCYSLQSQAMMGRLTERFEGNLRGLFAGQPPASGPVVLGEFQAENAVFFSLMMRYLRATALAAPLMELCGSLAVAALLYFGGTAVIAGRMTPGAFFAFLGAVLAAYAPIKNLARTNSDLQRALASGERIFELLERPRAPMRTA